MQLTTKLQQVLAADVAQLDVFQMLPNPFIPTIAHRLMVANVLEGSVRKYGNHLRVTAQLVRADSGYHLWSQTYDRDLHDVFKVQDEIANAVVQA